VRAGVFLKDSKSWESSEGVEAFKVVEGRQEAKYLESLKEGVATSDHRRTSSRGKGWNRSKFSKENL
jgi:hypothetical protein